MIAIDTSALVNFYNNSKVHPALERALDDGICVLPCVVLTEMLSAPKVPAEIIKNISNFPILYPEDQGYWSRVAELRKKALVKKYKARLADAMIAQLCLDSNVPLITQDKDFKVLAKFSKLKIL